MAPTIFMEIMQGVSINRASLDQCIGNLLKQNKVQSSFV